MKTSPDTHKTITEMFRDYVDQVLPSNVSDAQLLETERAFFAGAASMFNLLLTLDGEDGSEDEAAFEMMIFKLQDEIYKAGIRLTAGHCSLNITKPVNTLKH